MFRIFATESINVMITDNILIHNAWPPFTYEASGS